MGVNRSTSMCMIVCVYGTRVFSLDCHQLMTPWWQLMFGGELLYIRTDWAMTPIPKFHLIRVRTIVWPKKTISLILHITQTLHYITIDRSSDKCDWMQLLNIAWLSVTIVPLILSTGFFPLFVFWYLSPNWTIHANQQLYYDDKQ